MTAEYIKKKAKEFGATICGIGNVELFRGDDIQHNPFSILPNAKSIIGFGIKAGAVISLISLLALMGWLVLTSKFKMKRAK